MELYRGFILIGHAAESMKSSQGFTLLELIIVLIIAAILGAVIAPKFSDTKDFEARGFYDETFSLLRYAQKSAIAQRRTVCIAFTSNSATLTIASAAYSSACDTGLAGPDGTIPYTATAKGGVNYASVPAGFNFNPLGRPSMTTQTWQVAGMTQTITVEAETGYVH